MLAVLAIRVLRFINGVVLGLFWLAITEFAFKRIFKIELQVFVKGLVAKFMRALSAPAKVIKLPSR